MARSRSYKKNKKSKGSRKKARVYSKRSKQRRIYRSAEDDLSQYDKLPEYDFSHELEEDSIKDDWTPLTEAVKKEIGNKRGKRKKLREEEREKRERTIKNIDHGYKAELMEYYKEKYGMRTDYTTDDIARALGIDDSEARNVTEKLVGEGLMLPPNT